MSVTASMRAQDLRRSIANTFKGSLGNLVEWYDVYVYSTFATYFEGQLFGDAKNSSVLVWATFAVTFLMRPVGSWFFGRYADRHGRRAALTFSVSLMAACALVIALTPTAATIGVGAAVILMVARLVQGFATGGEYGTSATYMSEAAVPKYRGFFSSFQYVTLVGGQVVAQAVMLIMLMTTQNQMVDGKPTGFIAEWGWRIAFLIGAAGALVVLWLRRSMDESLTQDSLAKVRSGEAGSTGSMKELFGHYWKELLAVFIVTMGGTLAFYVYSINASNVVKTSFAGKDPVVGSTITLIALVILMLLQPVGGFIADKVGRKPLLVFFGVGGVLYTWVLFTVLPKTQNPFTAFLLLTIGFVILTGYTSINAIVKAKLFPTHIRALGLGLGYAVANSVFGGTAPLIWDVAKAQHATAFIVYVTVTIAVSLLFYIFGLRNHGPNWLDDEEEMHARKERKHKDFPVGV